MSIGWGTVAGWIFDQLPTKKETLLNRIDKMERLMDEITKKNPKSNRDVEYYRICGDKLRKYQEALRTIKA